MTQAPVPSGDGEALDAFIGKWRARWPEWSLAEVFVPSAQRAAAQAWAALQQELTDAAWGGSDPRPGEAKLMWWQDELQGWALGRRRHPLGSVLQRMPAPWVDVAAALPTLRDSRERPDDATDAFARLLPLAAAAAAIEQALFAGAAPNNEAARLVCATWLYHRFAGHPDTALPLSALARADAGAGAAAAWWRRELLRQWPAAGKATRPRRLWAALARQRLQRGVCGQPLSTWRTVWTAWRAARD